MKLSTIRVDNWRDFVSQHRLDVRCWCIGKGNAVQCLDCMGGRFVFPGGSIAYDSGYEVAGHFDRIPYQHVVAFEYERRIWLAPRFDTPDPTAFLGMAWIKLFPKCNWLPEQFGDVNSVPDYYAILPQEDADSLVTRLRQSLHLDLIRSQTGLQQLRDYEGKGQYP